MNQELRRRLLSDVAVRVQDHPADLESAVVMGLRTVRRRFLLSWVVAVAAALALTAGLVGLRLVVADPQLPPTPSLVSIAVASPTQTVSLNAGTKLPLQALGKYSDGSNSELQKGVSWSSSNVAIAAVSDAGLVSAVANGTVTVTASVGGVSGTLNLTVTPSKHPLTALRVTPDRASMVPGGKQQFTASGTYTDGSSTTLNIEAIWDTSNLGVAVVDGNGLVTASHPGTATISATLEGFSGFAVITVESPSALTAVGLSVDPAQLTLKVGKSAQLTAIATYADGTTRAVTNVAWATDPSKADKIAMVNATGLVTAQGLGTEYVKATLDGVPAARALVTVERSVTSIVVSPAGPLQIVVGQSVQLKALVHYDDGKTGTAVLWGAKSLPGGGKAPVPGGGSVSVSGSGLVTGRGAGQATVAASADGITSNAVVFSISDAQPTIG